MSAPLAPQFELPGFGRIENHHRLDAQAAVLGAAERQDVDPGPPRHVCRGAAGCHDGVGKSRTIHMDGQRKLARDACQGRDFGRAVGCARLGQVGQRHHAALRRVDIALGGVANRRSKRIGCHLAVTAGNKLKLAAADVKFGRAAFVGFGMGIGVAIYRAPWGAVDRKGQGIGRGSGSDEVDGSFGGLE